MKLDEPFIDSVAPNAAAMKNGRALVRKGALTALHVDPEDKVIFGTCKGSGKKDYQPSVDFSDPAQPVWRCNCPSRQFPCKHCLGLMYANAQGEAFTQAELPEDIKNKQAKKKTAAKKKAAKKSTTKKKRVNKSALTKKIGMQLEGLDLLSKLVEDVLRAGLATFNAKAAKGLSDQADRLASDHYLPGVKIELRRFIGLFFQHNDLKRGEIKDEAREAAYTPALEQLSLLYALAEKGKEALKAQQEDPELKPDATSPVTAWLGHAWKLTELEEAGLVEAGPELMQLAFLTWPDGALQAEVDLGVWLDLGSGTLHYTEKVRPKKARLTPDDSEFQIQKVEKLYLYPGQLNRRVRWERAEGRETTNEDFAKAVSHAKPVAELLKPVRDQLKSPLSDKTPYSLVQFSVLGRVGDELVLEDADGGRLRLVEAPGEEVPEVLPLLDRVPPQFTRDGAILGRWMQDLDKEIIGLVPLAILKPDEDVIRLV